MSRMFAPILVALFLVLPLRASAQGETTTAIVGQVRDATGAPIAGATVTIVSRETGMQRSLRSDQEGRFNFPQLKPGGYAVSCGAEGFDSQSVENVSAGLGQKQTVNFVLKVAQS